MKRNNSLGIFSKKLYAFLTAASLLCGVCLGLPAGSLTASAESAPLRMTTVNTWDKMTASYIVQGAEAGKTYTLSLYWYNLSSLNEYSRFLINTDGNDIELIYDNEARNGAVLNRNEGRYYYTFEAKAESVKLTFDMNDWINGKQRIVWFGGIQIVETDESGTPTEDGSELYCNSDTFADWNEGDGNNHLIENVSDIDYNHFSVNNALESVTDLGISYIADEFAYNNYSYAVNVPYEVTGLTVNPSVTENYASHTVSGNEGFEVGVPKDVVITVNDVKGGITAYTVTVTRQEELKDDQIRIMRLHEWNHDVGVNHRVTVEAGKTYKFTALWKCTQGTTPSVYLLGGAMGGNTVELVVKDEAKNGADYNKTTGLLTYTFTAQGADLEIDATMGNGAGEKDCYFAQPALFMVDESGEKIENSDIDCDPDFMTSWEYWGYGGDYRHVITADADFFMAYGDANGDGVFNILDLIRLKKYTAGLADTVVFEAIGKTAGDTVDSGDLTLARRGLLTGSGDVFKKSAAPEQSGEWNDPDTGDNGAADIFD